MKMKYIFIVLLFSFILIPINVKALFCDYSELARLKNIANNIVVSYNYVEENGDVKFNIALANIRPGIKIIDVSLNQVYRYGYTSANLNEIVLYGYNDDTTYRFDVYAESTACASSKLISLYANLPAYNKYYDDTICRGIENYSLCQKWSKNDLTYELFLKKVNEYKKSLVVDPIDETKNNSNNQFTYILTLLADYYYYFLIIVIAGGSYSIYHLAKKDDFDLKTK